MAAEGYVGIDVHRGARVAALAHGGQVLLTEATAALLVDDDVTDLGRHRLKDFDGLQRAFAARRGRFPPLRTPGAVIPADARDAHSSAASASCSTRSRRGSSATRAS